MKRILCILLLLACVANAETWIYGRSRLSTGYRQEKNNGKIPFSLYPPALWYEFSENNGGTGGTEYDLSGNDRNFVIPDAAWSNFTGNGCMRFNGSSSYLRQTNVIVNQPFTISVWVYYKVYNTVTATRMMAVDANEWILDNFGGIRFNGPGTAMSGASGMAVSNWYHVVAVANGTNSKVYVNGIQKLTGNHGTNNLLAANCDFGATGPPFNQSFLNGFLDSIIIFPSALTSNQAYTLYLRGR